MIRELINLYILFIIIDSVLSYMPQFRQASWAQFIKKISDFTCAPVRKLLPENLPADFSPLIVILGLQLIKLLW
ncbi:MAG: YggT family protein [Halobacteriovoraceae bacterium]|nr:YggT family protein [Halobacteriovoraceae bacterium]